MSLPHIIKGFRFRPGHAFIAYLLLTAVIGSNVIEMWEYYGIIFLLFILTGIALLVLCITRRDWKPYSLIAVIGLVLWMSILFDSAGYDMYFNVIEPLVYGPHPDRIDSDWGLTLYQLIGKGAMALFLVCLVSMFGNKTGVIEKGTMKKSILWGTVMTVPLLVLFLVLVLTGLQDIIVETSFRVLFYGVIFSVLNGTFEELIFRGPMLTALSQRYPHGLAVFLQAWYFGWGHFHGVPSGFIGVFLTIVGGIVLGLVMLRCRNIVSTIIPHIFADLTFVYLIDIMG
ncbi:MAG: CPBP family intramembrane metalloprotease [Candidatus Thermoplasmatota archaeon]|jgi:membrane protease YdiL (CAAX protease family)|nr:CPBP family intramembrane metalloprotease [Candidatus Thermoplasmatota archaeon]